MAFPQRERSCIDRHIPEALQSALVLWVAVASTEQEFAVLGLGTHVSPLVNTHRHVSCDATRPYLATIYAKTRFVDVVNMDSGARVTTLPHDQRVNDVAFDRSGKFTATVSEDNFVHLWTLEGREVVRRAALDPQFVIFSPDNSLIISSGDEQVQFHPWQTQDLLREARKRLRPSRAISQRHGMWCWVESELEQWSLRLWNINCIKISNAGLKFFLPSVTRMTYLNDLQVIRNTLRRSGCIVSNCYKASRA